MKDQKILKHKENKRMSPKELISLGASINQIVNILDNLDVLRRNLLFSKSLTNEQEVDLLKVYGIIRNLQSKVEEIIHKETK